MFITVICKTKAAVKLETGKNSGLNGIRTHDFSIYFVTEQSHESKTINLPTDDEFADSPI